MARGSVTLLFGPPSAGKTHLTLSIARALTEGSALWGRFATVKARVLLVQADMNTALYQERVRFHADALGANVAVLTTDAMPFDVTKIAAVDPVINAARNFAPDLVIVDSLRKSHALDENDSNAPDQVYSAWRRLFPGAALMFLHHSRKMPTQINETNRDSAIREAFRGSIAWAASADTIVMQRRVRKSNNPAWLTRVSFVRTRSCEEPASVLLKLSDTLTLEPLAESTTEFALLAWVTQNPRSKRVDAVKWMVETKLCAQATAYRLWDKVIKGELLSP